ncbi:hypothetical protein IEU95_11955 [Hoyosella rhizosphaerae]|uniref:ABM domain-containing protein n=1 Tax=Hoyosella rhizosphaerae TaxID=1755582 RepID=A0A916XDG3_9ACTN|nr:hypothetical protein [Hoyosella rhizosphaerae]MBN4927547.1 hypothetical protein [Hoyosella rhizosphaerae]GGC63603.1 hypothetical protein GCM10011410_15080 [Hoyosella rhizosphaerae]
MYARTTTVNAHPNSIDAGMRHIDRELMPMLQDLDGFVGLSVLVDRKTRRCIITSAWQTQEAMKASETAMRPARNRTAEAFGGRPQIDEWEIAALHRNHHSRLGSCARITWFRLDPENMDRAIDIYKHGVMPAAEELDGFSSASLMVDRETGIAVATVAYDNYAAMERSRARAEELRETAIADADAEVVEVCECELMSAHLHVPELV